MKVFLLNLDRDSERLKSAAGQLHSAGVDFERFPAVYGKDLPAETRAESYRHFRWWCAVGRPIRDGEIGCALSHYGVYKQMLSEDIPIACVFEDDVLVEGDLRARLSEVEAFCDLGRPQVFLLSNHTKRHGLGQGIQRIGGDRHAESYVLTKAAAGNLLKSNCPMAVPCDYWDRWAGSKAIELYHVFPTICRPNEADYASGTSPAGSFKVRDLPMPLFLLHKAKRLVGLCIDRFLLSMGIQ
jgi:glycosyl transferase family 25